MKTLSLIACVYYKYGKLIIGKNDELLVKLDKDMKYFRQVTSNVPGSVIVMGRATWFSIPVHQRPLENRFNIILTRNPDLLKTKGDDKHKFMNFAKFESWYKKAEKDVYIIGGGEIYNMFLSFPDTHFLKPSKLYITEVVGQVDNLNSQDSLSCINQIPESYKLTSATIKNYSRMNNVSFRFLMYKLQIGYNNTERTYLNLLSDVCKNGIERVDRTNTGTFSVLGRQTNIDISNSIPILTTKRVPWKSCIEELLWFLRGDTDANILSEKGVNIWNDNASREFLDSKGLERYREGVLGPTYGWQWRFAGADYSQEFSDTSQIDTDLIKGFDQIKYVLDLLKNDPFSRRIILSAWSPSELNDMALPPCHYTCQFYVREDKDKTKHLSCHYIMRSNDLFLGAPWNILSYSILTYILAIKTGMRPDRLIYSCTDAHIYSNHILQVKKQLERSPRAMSKLLVDPSVKDKDFRSMTVDDFDIVGYFPCPGIKAQMAI